MTAKGKSSASGIEHAIRCRTCALYYDKGVAPQKGQDDSLYVCDSCQDAANAETEKSAKRAR